MLEILIPTYNRREYLSKNLIQLIGFIREAELNNEVIVSISDNNSTDDSYSEVVRISAENDDITVNCIKQITNVGLERNTVSLLERSTSKFVMFLGDDDFIPNGYLQAVMNRIMLNDNLGCIIPGITSCSIDGKKKIVRDEKYTEIRYLSGLNSCLELSYLGHQMSGLVIRNDCVCSEYVKNAEFRNIYPFIYFVAYTLIRWDSIYVPRYKVTVTTGNSKDWNYDQSGLLTEMFKNYHAVLENQYDIHALEMKLIDQNRQRLRVSFLHPVKMARSYLNIMSSANVTKLTKSKLIYIYIREILYKVVGPLKR